MEDEKTLAASLSLSPSVADCNQHRRLEQAAHFEQRNKKENNLKTRLEQPLNGVRVLRLSQCFYLPKCRMGGAELQKEMEEVRNSLDAQLETSSLCLADRARHPGDAILNRKYGGGDALSALLWPCVMLGGGALLVGLVKLTQHLARLSAEMCGSGSSGGGTAGGPAHIHARQRESGRAPPEAQHVTSFLTDWPAPPAGCKELKMKTSDLI